MKNITYISASAGSGKTYTLTETLANLIIEKKVEPEQVIITTFTVKAAEEIRERAKVKLYEKAKKENMPELELMAQRLDNALINTIHSICNAFIQRYWFFLGITPEQNVLTDEDKAFYIDQSLSEVLTSEELHFLNEYGRLFSMEKALPYGADKSNTTFWKEDLKKIVDLASGFNIKDLKPSLEHSLNLVRRFKIEGLHVLPPSYKELNRILDEAKPFCTSKGNAEAWKKLHGNVTESYGFAKDLSTLLGGTKALKSIGEDFIGSYAQYAQSEEVVALEEKYITTIFNLAERWKSGYEDYKERHNILDFCDMERNMFRLLTEPQLEDVRKEIAEEYKYAFVDEYQDCSPLQVQMFDRLSNLLVQSYWVSDAKQAIYGFRGTDSILTDAVVDNIDSIDSCKLAKPLDTSYRSVPAIVDAVNKTFIPLFSEMSEERVVLKTCEKKAEDGKQIENSLRFVELHGKNLSEEIGDLAYYINDLVNNQGVTPSDIAVLARGNDYLNELADILYEYDLPVNRSYERTIKDDDDIKRVGVYDLIFAILKIIDNPYDEIAKTQIANLTAKGYINGKIIDEKLAWDELPKEERGEFLADVPMIKRIVASRPNYQHHSIKNIVETIIVEQDLYSEAVRMCGDASILQYVMDLAAEYEERCCTMAIPSTIPGFINYAWNAPMTIDGNPDGITLTTYHGSKGLQWKYVILASLNNKLNDSPRWGSRNYKGVNTEHPELPTKENLYPQMRLRLQPWVLGASPNLTPEMLQCCDEEHIKAIKEENVREGKRLMYVGMTRAADVLILAARISAKGAAQLNWFDEIGLSTNSNPSGDDYDCLGIEVSFKIEHLEEPEPELTSEEGSEDTSEGVTAESEENATFEPAFGEVAGEDMPPVFVQTLKSNICDAPLRDQQPSGMKDMGKVERVAYWNKRLRLKGSIEDNVIGNCIHSIFCGIESDSSIEHINATLAAYGLEPGDTTATDIIDTWKRFYGLMTEKYGKPVKTYHELGFKHKFNGQIFTGSMDFVWETAEGCVLVDYKTCQLGVTHIEDENNEKGFYAGKYKGQFDCYAAALKQAGKTIVDRLIFYPSSGLVVRFV